jgi:hypothetical protein
MKKVRQYTLRGQLDPSTLNERVQLYDGRFDTAFRIVKFEVSTINPTTSSADASIIITTDATITGNNWNWQDQTQIAWASYLSQGGDSGVYHNSFIDPDHLIVEDIYISAFVADGQKGNYMLTLEQYETIPVWRAALAMVRNRAQGDRLG